MMCDGTIRRIYERNNIVDDQFTKQNERVCVAIVVA